GFLAVVVQLLPTGSWFPLLSSPWSQAPRLLTMRHPTTPLLQYNPAPRATEFQTPQAGVIFPHVCLPLVHHLPITVRVSRIKLSVHELHVQRDTRTLPCFEQKVPGTRAQPSFTRPRVHRGFPRPIGQGCDLSAG